MQVWDLPLRVFHWALVVGIVAAYVTGELSGLWLTWHAQIGLCILGLWTFRMIWGVMGTTYSRFYTFFPTSVRLKDYFAGRWHGLGHNPLGALSVIAMLLIIAFQVISGLFAYNDEIDFHGPLAYLISEDWSRRMTHWHESVFDIVMALIAIHVLAIGYYTWAKRKNLTKTMITGIAAVADNTIVLPITGGGIWRFFIAACIAVASVGSILFFSSP